jgi:thioredoxin 1
MFIRYLLFLFFITSIASANIKTLAKPFKDDADAKKDIAEALNKAKNSKKLVLLDFGANWCGDCLVLSDKMKVEPLKTLIENNFEMVHISVNKKLNRDLVKKYDRITRKGIPSIVILSPKGDVLIKTLNGELEPSRSLSVNAITGIFEGFIKQSHEQLSLP